MQLELKDILKPGVELSTVQDFAKAKRTSSTAVYYSMSKGHVVYVTIGDRSFIVVNHKVTQAYTPNKSSLRKKPIKKRKVLSGKDAMVSRMTKSKR